MKTYLLLFSIILAHGLATEVQTRSENDQWGGTDRWYSNAFIIDYWDAGWHFQLHQSIFTPKDITQKLPQKFDYPWAGVLVFSAGTPMNDTNSLGLTFGYSGYNTGAQRTQEKWHRLLGYDHPVGWNNQMHSEGLINLHYSNELWRQKRGIGKLNLNSDSDLGSLNTSTGLRLQYGYNTQNDDYSFTQTAFIPSVTGNKGWSYLCGLRLSYVAWEYPVMGSLWYGRIPIEHRPIQLNAYSGLQYRLNHAIFGIGYGSCSPKAYHLSGQSIGSFSIGWNY